MKEQFYTSKELLEEFLNWLDFFQHFFDTHNYSVHKAFFTPCMQALLEAYMTGSFAAYLLQQ